jgi:hypothetical protein
MKYPDSGVHFSFPLIVARVRSSLKLRAFFVLRQRGRFFCSVFVVFAALLRCCAAAQNALAPAADTRSLLSHVCHLCSALMILSLLQFFWTFAISHEAAALS